MGLVYHVYALCCPLTGDPKYIGQTWHTECRLKEHIRESLFDINRCKKKDWIRDLYLRGMVPNFVLLCRVDNRGRANYYEKLCYKLLSENHSFLNKIDLNNRRLEKWRSPAEYQKHVKEQKAKLKNEPLPPDSKGS